MAFIRREVARENAEIAPESAPDTIDPKEGRSLFHRLTFGLFEKRDQIADETREELDATRRRVEDNLRATADTRMAALQSRVATGTPTAEVDGVDASVSPPTLKKKTPMLLRPFKFMGSVIHDFARDVLRIPFMGRKEAEAKQQEDKNWFMRALDTTGNWPIVGFGPRILKFFLKPFLGSKQPDVAPQMA